MFKNELSNINFFATKKLSKHSLIVKQDKVQKIEEQISISYD